MIQSTAVMMNVVCGVTVDLYEATGEVLGEGSHGAVHCYIHKHTDIEYAVKVITSNHHYYFSNTVLAELYLMQTQISHSLSSSSYLPGK